MINLCFLRDICLSLQIKEALVVQKKKTLYSLVKNALDINFKTLPHTIIRYEQWTWEM